MRNSLASLLLFSAGFAQAQQPPAAPVTAQEWKRVHKHPKTSEDFRVCARWARQQAEINQRKQAIFEADLEAMRERPANHEGPKYPPTQDQLSEEINYYRGRTQHWMQLAAGYEREATVR